jgi:DNA-binding transcriptional regulator YdaS (Cro superfamily)
MKPLKRAIALCGNQKAFAARLTAALKARGLDREISQQIVSYWSSSASGLPSTYCIDVEEMLNFQVTKHELRPDVFGDKPYVPITESTNPVSVSA